MASVNAEAEAPRARLAARLEAALGWHDPLAVARAAHRGSHPVPGGTCTDLALTLSDGTDVPALWVTPARRRRAALVYCHAHGNRYDTGRAELLVGRPALLAPWASDLAADGIAALCLDMPCFGQRQHPGEAALAKAHHWHGRTLFGRMLAELRAALGWLAADHDRVGALGFSMGGTQAWWLAALDARVTAAASLGAFADLGTLVARGAHDLHGPYMTVPGLLAIAPTGAIAGLAAPRGLFVGGGLDDPGTPPDAVASALAPLRAAYAMAPRGRLETRFEPRLGHRESAGLRAAARAFLVRHLGAGP